jgi:hypothetical protein
MFFGEITMNSGLTNVLSIELIDAHQDPNGSSSQSPSKDWAQYRKLTLMDVIYQAVVELFDWLVEVNNLKG